MISAGRMSSPAKTGRRGQSLLSHTRLMTGKGVTVGSVLLFGMMLNRFLLHSGIDAVANPVPERGLDARECMMPDPDSLV